MTYNRPTFLSTKGWISESTGTGDSSCKIRYPPPGSTLLTALDCNLSTIRKKKKNLRRFDAVVLKHVMKKPAQHTLFDKLFLPTGGVKMFRYLSLPCL